MEKKTIYIANDGKEFTTEKECVEHEIFCEIEREKAVLKEAVIVDNTIWKRYCPELIVGEEIESAPLHLAIVWLRNDIVDILKKAKNVEDVKQEIIEYIKTNEFGDEIISRLNFVDINEEVTIRRDFAKAFETVKNGSDLSHILRYSLGRSDLEKLAILHKAKKSRKKIEELLMDCNFHCECADFRNGKYDKYKK